MDLSEIGKYSAATAGTRTGLEWSGGGLLSVCSACWRVRTSQVMGASFPSSATPFELLKAQSLCLEQVTQMKQSLKRKKAVIFWLLTVIQAHIMPFSPLLPSCSFL